MASPLPYEYVSISDVTDASKGTGIKRYWLKADAGVTQAQIETLGFFSKYELRGWKKGDLIAIITDARHLLYQIVGDNNASQHIEVSLVPAVYGTDDQTAAEVPLTTVAFGPIAGDTEVQAALEDLNRAADDLQTLSGVAANDTDLGAFTGGTIPDGRTVKQALQDIETAFEAQPPIVSGDAGNDIVVGGDGGAYFQQDITAIAYTSPNLQFTDENGAVTSLNIGAANLQYTDPGVGPLNGVTTVGVALDTLNTEGARLRDTLGNVNTQNHMGVFTGATIPDNISVKAALQSLETALEAVPAQVTTTLVNNANGSFTYTNEVGAAVTYTEVAVTVTDDNIVNLTAGGTRGHAINASIDIDALVTALAANANFVAAVNNIITSRFSWDGTNLCFDFNNDGNPAA